MKKFIFLAIMSLAFMPLASAHCGKCGKGDVNNENQCANKEGADCDERSTQAVVEPQNNATPTTATPSTGDKKASATTPTTTTEGEASATPTTPTTAKKPATPTTATPTTDKKK